MPRSISPRHVLAAFIAIAALAPWAGTSGAQPNSPSASPCSGEPRTCNEDGSICCDWWIADVLVDGHVTGAVLENSYADLTAALGKHARTDKLLCGYFHDASDCNATFGPPRCSGTTAGAMKEVAAPTVAAVGDITKEAEKKLTEVTATKTLLDKVTKADHLAWAGATLFKGGAASMSVATEGVAAVKDELKDHLTTAGKGLLNYGEALGDAIGRVKRLRGALSDCMNSVNPFLDLDAAAPTDGLPQVWHLDLGYGFPVTSTTFGPPSSQRRQAIANDDGRRSLRGIVSQAPTLPRFAPVTIDAPASVLSAKVAGRGRIVWTDRGTLEAGDALPDGQYQVLFAASDGSGLKFVSPDVSRSSTADGDVVTISAASGITSESISILVCSGGRLMKGKKCACPATMSFTAGQCACPQDMHLSASGRCESCPSGQAWNNVACACPGDTHLIAGICQTCPADSVYNGSQCASACLSNMSAGCGKDDAECMRCVDIPSKPGVDEQMYHCTDQGTGHIDPQSLRTCCNGVGGTIFTYTRQDAVPARLQSQPKCPW